MDFLTKMARNRALGGINKSISIAYEEKRLICNPNETYSYTDKEGLTTDDTLCEVATLLWNKHNDALMKLGGMVQTNLSAVNITNKDIENIILKLTERRP